MKKYILLLANLCFAFLVRAQNVGIGTTTPNTTASLHIETGTSTTHGLLLTGTYTAGSAVPDLNGGYRMMVYPGKSAFRVGFCSGTQWNNVNVGDYSTAIGYSSRATGTYSICLGTNNFASGSLSTTMGDGTIASNTTATAMGSNTTASGSASTSMGNGTIASNTAATAMGSNTTASGSASTSMGNGTTASGANSTAIGFNTNAIGAASVVMGNGSNTTVGGANALAMGLNSQASGPNSVAMGNTATASGASSVSLGVSTNASGLSAVATGTSTIASGNYSAAFGNTTTASGDYSFAAGRNVSTGGHAGGFFLGDSDPNNKGVRALSVNDQFAARFNGGYYLMSSNSGADIGVQVLPGANSWSAISDVCLKENFLPVSGESFLEKISKMNLTTWNYKTQDPKTFRHYGPMAQDFYAAFGKDGLGTIGCDTLINQQDFLGVNLIAIQALEKRTENLSEENSELRNEVSDLKTRLDKLEKLLQDKQ